MAKQKKQKPSTETGTPKASPYAKPAAVVPKGDPGMVGRVRYVGEDGGKVKMGLVPSNTLEELKRSAATGMKLSSPQLRVLHVRGPGQEVEIFDDLDYKTFLSRLSLSESSTLTLKLIPTAPSTAPIPPAPSAIAGPSTPKISHPSPKPSHSAPQSAPAAAQPSTPTPAPKKRKRSSSPPVTHSPAVSSPGSEGGTNKREQKRLKKMRLSEGAAGGSGIVGEEVFASPVAAQEPAVAPPAVGPEEGKPHLTKAERKREKKARREAEKRTLGEGTAGYLVTPPTVDAPTTTPAVVEPATPTSKPNKKRKRTSSAADTTFPPSPSTPQPTTPSTAKSTTPSTSTPTDLNPSPLPQPPKKSTISLTTLAPPVTPGSAFKPFRPSPLAQSTIPGGSPSSDVPEDPTPEEKEEKKRLKKEKKAARALAKAEKVAKELSIQVPPVETSTGEEPGSPGAQGNRKRRRNGSSAGSTPTPAPETPEREVEQGEGMSPKKKSKKSKRKSKGAAGESVAEPPVAPVVPVAPIAPATPVKVSPAPQATPAKPPAPLAPPATPKATPSGKSAIAASPAAGMSKGAIALAEYRARQAAEAAAKLLAPSSTATSAAPVESTPSGKKEKAGKKGKQVDVASPVAEPVAELEEGSKRRKKEKKQKERAAAAAASMEAPSVATTAAAFPAIAPPATPAAASTPKPKKQVPVIPETPAQAQAPAPVAEALVTPVKPKPARKEAKTPITALPVPQFIEAEKEESIAPSTPTDISDSDDESVEGPKTVDKGKGKAVEEVEEEETEDVESDEEEAPEQPSTQASTRTATPGPSSDAGQDDEDDEITSAVSERYPSPTSSIEEAPVSQRRKRPSFMRTPSPERVAVGAGDSDDEDDEEEDDDAPVRVVGIQYDREVTPKATVETEDGEESESADTVMEDGPQEDVDNEDASGSAEVLVPATLPESRAQGTAPLLPIVVSAESAMDIDETQPESAEHDILAAASETHVAETPTNEEVPSQEVIHPAAASSSLLSPDDANPGERRSFAQLRDRSASLVIPNDAALDSVPNTPAEAAQTSQGSNSAQTAGPSSSADKATSPPPASQPPAKVSTPVARGRKRTTTVEVVVPILSPERPALVTTPIATRTRRRASASPALEEGPSSSVPASVGRRATRSTKPDLAAISEDGQVPAPSPAAPKVLTYDSPAAKPTRPTVRTSSRLSQEPAALRQEDIPLPSSTTAPTESPEELSNEIATDETVGITTRRGKVGKATSDPSSSAPVLEKPTSGGRATRSQPQSSPAPLVPAPAASIPSHLARNQTQALRQANRVSCIICGAIPTHVQKRCPIVQEGLGKVRERLTVVRALRDDEEDGLKLQALDMSISAMEMWETRLKKQDPPLGAVPATVREAEQEVEQEKRAANGDASVDADGADERGASESLEAGETSSESIINGDAGGEVIVAIKGVAKPSSQAVAEEAEESEDEVPPPSAAKPDGQGPLSPAPSSPAPSSQPRPAPTQSQEWQQPSGRAAPAVAAIPAIEEEEDELSEDSDADDTSDTESASSSSSDESTTTPHVLTRSLPPPAQPVRPIRTLSSLSAAGTSGFTSLSELPIEALKSRNGSSSGLVSPAGSNGSRVGMNGVGKGKAGADSDSDSSSDSSDSSDEEELDEEVRKRLVGGKGKKPKVAVKGW